MIGDQAWRYRDTSDRSSPPKCCLATSVGVPSARRAGLDYLVILIWVAAVTALGFVARTLAPDLSQALFADP